MPGEAIVLVVPHQYYSDVDPQKPHILLKMIT
jgi:hypothetical protein